MVFKLMHDVDGPFVENMPPDLHLTEGQLVRPDILAAENSGMGGYGALSTLIIPLVARSIHNSRVTPMFTVLGVNGWRHLSDIS